MAVFSSLRFASVVAALAAVGDATTYLSPAQDVLLPASGSVTNPLEWLGANGPYYAGESFLSKSLYALRGLMATADAK